jgi:hypothetical protein
MRQTDRRTHTDTHTHTCLGRAGAPPYHWNRAFHSESGTNSKSRHLTSIRFRFSLPPSPVRVTTLQVGAATRIVLSMGPGAGGGPTVATGMAFRGWRGEWLGLDVTLGDLKQHTTHVHCGLDVTLGDLKQHTTHVHCQRCLCNSLLPSLSIQ